jgi:hypothetical protein
MPAPPLVAKPAPRLPEPQPETKLETPTTVKQPVVTVEHLPDTQPPRPEPVPVGGPPPLPSTAAGRLGRPIVIPPAPLGQIPNKPKKQVIPKRGTDPYERLDKSDEPLDPYKGK